MGARHELSFHFRLYTYTDNMLFNKALIKKTLWREEKASWKNHGFDNKLKKQLNWKQSEYDAYEAFMAKQKKRPKQLVTGKAPRKKIFRAIAQKVAATKSGSPKKKHRYHPGTVALRQI